ncbi:MAG TPA: MFS transporter, partial [Acidimicrobiales bacterium]|nr:MFS transporter [Acidimicrobiales bacterium]
MLVTRYLRWSGLRAASARGWWLVTAVYLVVEADLTPFQLVFIGTAQGLVVVLAEVPAGVFADTVGRRASIVVAHLASGTGMVLVAFVTDYPLVLLSQCLWGVGWAFTSGADVAWITDELGDRSVVDRVLARSARWSLAGGAAGTVVFGLLAGATSLRLAIVCGGSLMLLLGVAVVARFPETAFVPVATSRWRHAASVFSGGVRVARADRAVLAIILATLLVNGGHEGFGRLQDLRLLSLGFAGGDDGSTPVVWFTVLAVVGL